MENVKMLVFDMDGTIADLYGVEGWLPMLRNENPLPYIKAKPMWDMEILADLLNEFRAQGGIVAVVSWLSMGSSQQYKEMVRLAKREWLESVGFPADYIHLVQYGATKANSVRKRLAGGGSAVLFDDSEKVRSGWTLGETIDPTEEDIIEVIRGLLG